MEGKKHVWIIGIYDIYRHSEIEIALLWVRGTRVIEIGFETFVDGL